MEVLIVSTGLVPFVILAWLVVAKFTGGAGESNGGDNGSVCTSGSGKAGTLTCPEKDLRVSDTTASKAAICSRDPLDEVDDDDDDEDEDEDDDIDNHTDLMTDRWLATEVRHDVACSTPNSCKRLSRRQRKNNRKREKDDRAKQVEDGRSNSASLAKSPTSLSSTTTISFKLSSKQVRKRKASRQYEKLGLPDFQIYKCLIHYLIQNHRLRRLGFPMESELHPGKAYVYQDPEFGCKSVGDTDDDYLYDDHHHQRPPRLSSLLDVNAREFYPSPPSTSSSPLSSSSKSSTALDTLFHSSSSTSVLSPSAKEFVPMCYKIESSPSSSSTTTPPIKTTSCPRPVIIEFSSVGSEAKQCVRCSKVFYVAVDGGENVTNETCTYHWGKLRTRRVHADQVSLEDGLYTCCGATAADSLKGCCRCPVHVWRHFTEPGMHGPLDGYVRTRLRKYLPPDGNYGIYALDGEMCFTTNGLELTKLTVVGIDGRLVYETLILPDGEILDYNTRFSGISSRDLKQGPAKSLREVQNDVMGFLNENTILIGHGLENDLRALKLIHCTIIDTSLVFPHYFGLPYRRSLKSLAKSYLKQEIQTACWGHDSYEDARACVELMLWKVRKDLPLFGNKLCKDFSSNVVLQ